MNRRKFLGSAATGTVLTASSTLATPAISQGLIEWRMVTSWPKGLPGAGTSADYLGETITRMSDGRLTVKVFGAGELVPGNGVFDAVSTGAAEMFHSISAYWRGKSPGIALFGSVPFGMLANEQYAWMHHGGGQALYDEMYDRFELKSLLCGNTGTQWMGWFKKEINSLEDFKGLRFRTPGIGGEMYRRLGAAVVQLPGSEIYQALSSGTIDAAEFVGPWSDLALGFHQAAKYYYWPGVQEPGSAEECGINKQKWDELPDDLKAIVEAACAVTYSHSTTEYMLRNPEALKVLVDQHGVQVRKAPEDLIAAAAETAGEIINELREDPDELVRRITESYIGFREIAMDSAYYTDGAMMQARNFSENFGK